MKKLIGLFLSVFIVLGIVGCSDNEEGESPKESEIDGKEVNGKVNKKEKATHSLSLPDEIPADFPMPENITITEIDDDSDADRYEFNIKFTFDPNMDLDELFTRYKEYAEDLDYMIIIGGEEFFADDIYQFGATSRTSTSNMFIVTLKPDESTYGHIQIKIKVN